ncbi:ankyrin repeat domain-containing protein 39 [Silurus meridionalis]|nr:ankyrin repeat domain-containing protein 39 [Silurus meridionalis]
MGERKDLGEFDKHQIVTSRRLGRSISNTAAFFGGLQWMCVKRALWWMVVCVVMLQVSSQHWSHGLNPGGKRATMQEHYASRAAHQQVCELLLDYGACANSQTHGGATALHRAAYCGHISIIKLLLEHRADPRLTDDDGSTPLHKAAEQGHLETCTLLVSSSPILRTIKDKKSRLPLDLSPDHKTFLELLNPPE